MSSVFSHKNDKAFTGCTQKEQTSCSAIRCSPLWKMQAPGNSYGSTSFQTGPGPSQIFKALLKIDFQAPISFSIQFSLSAVPRPRYFLLKLKLFPPLLPSNTPRQACHLLYICILQATASNQKDRAFHVLLGTGGGESNMLKGGTSS